MRKIVTIFFIYLSVMGFAQNKSLSVNGYLKFLGTFTHLNKDYIPQPLQSLFPTTTQDYQIHNRINAKWYGPKGFSATLGVRNQLYWGYQVKNNKDYGLFLDDPGFLNLSAYWNSENIYFRIFIDRLYLQWQGKKWNIKLGRQRINWGINTTFNPNDLFNQYNYFDFDYEERPGVDAIFTQYYINSKQSIEMAFTPGADSLKQSVGAALYKINKYKYDWQFLGGYFQNDIAVGLGFAGNLGKGGLKGEATYFAPLDTKISEANFVAAAGYEYSFKNSISVSFSALYNDLGTTSPSILDQIQVTQANLSAKNIFPYKYTLMATVQYPFGALVMGSLAWIQTPNFANAFAVPQVSVSITQNLDAMVLAQIFFATNAIEQDQWGYFSSYVFGRLKYSF